MRGFQEDKKQPGYGKKDLQEFAGIGHSDMGATDADGNPKPGFSDRSSKPKKDDPKALYQMPLTKEEQDIMDGKKGEELAKVMKIVVAHGNAFNAEKLVDLGGAPHSSLFTGQDYLMPIISMFQQCADAGLKAYAPYTVNPRCYDVYNVENNAKDMKVIYELYGVQRDLDWMHAQLGAPDLNYRSCACYVDEVGNRPKPGTYVAWAESSAVNYGNSALGLRTNRNASGMELLCALVGKAPLFGLMTDEGRMSTWLVDVKTTKEPDWGVLGTAIGLKVVEANPFITGIDKYLGTKVSNDNMHLLKKMGSATASSGAVGLYHVENLTPDAKEKGRKLLKKGYQTYVFDDKEQARVLATYPTDFPERPKDPTVAIIGCPHNTYQEMVDWAIATRMDPAKDVIIIPEVGVYPLNPAASNRSMWSPLRFGSSFCTTGAPAVLLKSTMRSFSASTAPSTNQRPFSGSQESLETIFSSRGQALWMLFWYQNPRLE